MTHTDPRPKNPRSKKARKPVGKPRRILRGVLVVLGAVAVFLAISVAMGMARRPHYERSYIYSAEVRTIEDAGDQGVGTVQVSTLRVPQGIMVETAHFSPTGHVLLRYSRTDGSTEQGFAVMDDDGSHFRVLVAQAGEGGKLLPFADNTRILLGDSVLECPEGTTLDTCPEGAAAIVPLVYPQEMLDDPKVARAWSEVVVSPDCEHVAWTMLRTDCGAANALGQLVRGEDGYTVEDARYCSSIAPFALDADDPARLVPLPVVGGEVKQFVHGGAALSLVGADASGASQSVVTSIATGATQLVTNCPGYDETTIFSPDERYGMTMTTRFSPTTDLGVLGLVPRPFGDPVRTMASTIYTYGVTGVRSERQGNVGPALINIQRSMSEKGYVGIDLSSPDENWVYASPMSWNGDGTKAMWMERQRQGGGVRVQVVMLLEAEHGDAVPAVETPEPGDWAPQDPAVADLSGTVQGKLAGVCTVSQSSGLLAHKSVELVYDGYSDDGVHFYTGTESCSSSILTPTDYAAQLTVTDASGAQVGSMDVELHFGAAYSLASAFTGSTTPHLDLSRSHGTATWYGQTLTADQLVE